MYQDFHFHVYPKHVSIFNIYFYLKLTFQINITLLVTATLEMEASSVGLEQATLVTFLLFNHDCSQIVIPHERQFYKIKLINNDTVNKIIKNHNKHTL